MVTRGNWGPAMLAASCIAAAGCWPFDYSEDYTAPPATATGAGGEGGTGGSGGEGGAPPVTDLYVDPVGGNDPILATDSGGTLEKPFKTLKRALSVAVAGQTVHLFSGTYGAESGEDFATPVPDGVSITAIVPGEAVLVGTGIEMALLFDGGGGAEGLQLESFDTAIAVDRGEVLLANLDISASNLGVSVAGDARVTLAGSTIADGYFGVEARASAEVTMTGGELRGIGPTNCSGGAAVGIYDASRAMLDGVHVHDGSGDLEARGAADMILKGSTIELIGNKGCGGSESIVLYEAATLKLQDTVMTATHKAIQSYGAAAKIELVGGRVDGGSYDAIAGYGTLSIDGTELVGLPGYITSGIALGFQSVSLNNAKIHGFVYGVDMSSGTVRSSELSGNNVGMRLYAGATVDMGTGADPGGNVIQGNTQTGIAVYGGNHTAMGNTWLPLNQGTNGAGQFPIGTTFNGPFGGGDATPRNVYIASAGASVKLAVDILP